MKPEHRVWWEALADQYEEWAEGHPVPLTMGNRYTLAWDAWQEAERQAKEQ